jgi:hypothetical protein
MSKRHIITLASRVNNRLLNLTLLVPIGLAMFAAALIASFCCHPIASGAPLSGAPSRADEPTVRVERQNQSYDSSRRRLASRATIRSSLPTRVGPQLTETNPRDTQFQQLCRATQCQIDGTVTVALGHNDQSRYYPNEQAAGQSQRAASVIKLQLVARALRQGGDCSLELCRRTISQSDNDAANELMRIVGIDTVNRFSQTAGYRDTVLVRPFNVRIGEGYNSTSAADQVQFLRDLWEGRVLLPEERRLMLDWMLAQERRTKIPRYLEREGYIVYNKTGETWEPPVQNDVAIVRRGEDVWFLAILTADSTKPDGEVRQAIAELAKALVTSF